MSGLLWWFFPDPARTRLPLPAPTKTADVPPSASMSPPRAWLSTQLDASTSWWLPVPRPPPALWDPLASALYWAPLPAAALPLRETLAPPAEESTQTTVVTV